MLSADDIRRFQERLEGQRRELESRITTSDRGVQDTVQDEVGVGDFEDESSNLYERETELDDDARDRNELAQVQKALDRIKQGTYGLSEVSGKPIPIERLEAIPSATTLVGERPPEPE